MVGGVIHIREVEALRTMYYICGYDDFIQMADGLFCCTHRP